MSVRSQARGRGVASGMTAVTIRRAAELGCHRIVRHTSEMAAGLYRRAGFTPQCELRVHGTAPLWSAKR